MIFYFHFAFPKISLIIVLTKNQYLKHHEGSILLLLAAALTFINLNSIHSQTPEMDSLRAVWEDSSQLDSTRLKAADSYLKLQSRRHRPDTAICEGMYELAVKCECWPYAIKALNFSAGASFFVQNFELARKQVEQRLELSKTHGTAQDIADAYTSLGQIA